MGLHYDPPPVEVETASRTVMIRLFTGEVKVAFYSYGLSKWVESESWFKKDGVVFYNPEEIAAWSELPHEGEI